jgi:hypothetical protein
LHVTVDVSAVQAIACSIDAGIQATAACHTSYVCCIALSSEAVRCNATFAAATARAFMATPMFSLPKELVLPQPLDACDEVQNKNQLRDKVVLVSTGNCT